MNIYQWHNFSKSLPLNGTPLSVMRCLDDSFPDNLGNLVKKEPICWWFVTPRRSCSVIVRQPNSPRGIDACGKASSLRVTETLIDILSMTYNLSREVCCQYIWLTTCMLFPALIADFMNTPTIYCSQWSMFTSWWRHGMKVLTSPLCWKSTSHRLIPAKRTSHA